MKPSEFRKQSPDLSEWYLAWKYATVCRCGFSHDECECKELEEYYKAHPEELAEDDDET